MLDTSGSFSNQSKIIGRRIFFFSIIKVAVFFSIIGRLFYLQISENIKYRSLSDKNRLREWKVVPQRGIIEDYFGNKIASNKQVFQLHMMPEDVPNIEALFFKLSKLIDFSEREKVSLLKRLKKRKPWQPIIISDNLSWSEFSKLNLFLHEVPGIKPVVSVARKYIGDGSLSHLVGYVSAVSSKDLESDKYLRSINIPGLKTGKSGLEKSLNNLIIGEPGFQRFEVNAYGKRVKELEFTQGVYGKNYRTTIDTEIQKYASGLIIDKSGSVCVMDIFTGDVVAMVSSPTFDPNQFVHGISLDNWKKLIEDTKKPLMNKSLSGLYPPGSTIKPIVALSALENGIVSPKFVVECKGSIDFYGKKHHCWKEKGHGFMGMRNAIKQSCDIYFYEISRRLGIDRLSETAKKFGLGRKAFDIFYEEKKGVVPNKAWKKEILGESWMVGETLSAGIGQGYFLTTSAQLSLALAQIVNGGNKLEPSIVVDYNSDNSKKLYDTQLLASKGHLELIKQSLINATNTAGGTSYRSRIFGNLKMGGKTGTSQVRVILAKEREEGIIKNKDLPWEERDHGLFIGYGPVDEPLYSIAVIIEHGGSGSGVAAPLAKKIFGYLFKNKMHITRKKLTNV